MGILRTVQVLLPGPGSMSTATEAPDLNRLPRQVTLRHIYVGQLRNGDWVGYYWIAGMLRILPGTFRTRNEAIEYFEHRDYVVLDP